MQVLSRCELEGEYAYHPLTHKRDELRIRDRDALWAKLPLGAARLESALSREGQLNVDMIVVGQREAGVDQARAIGNAAACSGATHLVTAMTVGAFSLYTGSAIDGDVGASVHGAGGGVSLARSTETLRRDGDLARCGDTNLVEARPPAQCGALLRVELAPLGVGGSLLSAEHAQNATEAEALRTAAERWSGVRRGARIGTGLTVAGALGAGLFAGVRSIQIGMAEFDRDLEAQTADEHDPFFASDAEQRRASERVAELDADIDRYRSSRRAATFAGVGLAVGAAALIGLAAGARNRSHTLERRAERLSVAPLGGPGLGGLTVEGRF